jgi:SAM-dependent methyltransferase
MTRIPLKYIADTQGIFSRRALYSLPANPDNMIFYPGGPGRECFLITSRNISRKILVSNAFESLDYFSNGIRKTLESDGKSSAGEFFKRGPVFSEGPGHLDQRRKLLKLLETYHTSLPSYESLLHDRLSCSKRAFDPIRFAEKLTVFCLATMIADLLQIPFKRAARAVLTRSNVWVAFFHAQRHRRLERALLELTKEAPPVADTSDDAQLKLILAQALIVMGYDPLVGAISAMAINRDLVRLAGRSVHATCPVSYVTRQCVRDVTIEGVDFKAGAVIHEIGGHNIELSVCDDQELMIRTYLHTKFHHIHKVLYIYRITGDNSWLERNEAIQIKTKELHNQYAQQLAERDADLNGLLKIDMGGGLFPRAGYTTIDQEDGDITCDLNDGIPLEDNSVGVLNASHVIEHLKDPIKTMREIHRVLAHGGWAFIEVPSTEGNGAWCDPTHVSFWNEDSFPYYTKQSKAQFIRNKDIRFMSLRLETNWWEGTKIAVVNTHLVALKEGPRFPGPVEI